MADNRVPDGAPWSITDDTESMFELNFPDSGRNYMMYKGAYHAVCGEWPSATARERRLLVTSMRYERDHEGQSADSREPTCRHCAHWGVKIEINPGFVDFPEDHVDVYRDEDEPSLVPEEVHHLCALTVSKYEKLHPETKAYVEGYDGGHAARGLWTKADFGCNQWRGV